MEQQKLELNLQVTHGPIKAVEFIAQNSSFSKSMIKKIMQRGAVWHTRKNKTSRLRRATKELKAQDRIDLYYDSFIIEQVPKECRLIADEKQYSLWYKPSGSFSQGTKYGDHCTVIRWAEQHLKPQRNAFVVHRLDRAAQGLILLAHSRQAAAAFSALFKQRRVKKIYRVIVQGKLVLPEPPPLKIETPLEGKSALSFVMSSDYNESKDQSSLEVSIHTGRKHQIRQHLAGLGHPVLGDRLYGPDSNPPMDLQLTAIQLSFICPMSGKEKQYRI